MSCQMIAYLMVISYLHLYVGRMFNNIFILGKQLGMKTAWNFKCGMPRFELQLLQVLGKLLV